LEGPKETLGGAEKDQKIWKFDVVLYYLRALKVSFRNSKKLLAIFLVSLISLE